ncbi:hypothetical protein [Flavobacterium urumqiense]|uniref:Lipocalin-like domain-containing protein n=1 Tax=Flavobacterium urumqiense TaxID=935224 RepID=A0A1H5WFG3_9FLAO|nr:hypothetical protein [Flavobacterium urumqiense]SEF98202.1 hypothetical protein SAMN04488130_104167 [Flavobacterium urumqiense]
MKHLIILIAFLSVFNSCSKDLVPTDNTGYYGKWTLIKMSGSMVNSETTGAAMEWQEFYLFKINRTFIKFRERNGIKTTISGTYTTTNHPDGFYFELTYPNDSEVIGSCYGNLKEELYITESNILSSTWKNCDGPGLEYKK